MPAQGKITLDASQYTKTIEELKKQTRTASGDMSKSVGNFGKEVGKGAGIVRNLSQTVGGAFGQIGSTIASLASGPVAALAAGFGALVAAGVDMWDRLTLSAEEYAAKLDAETKIEEKRLGELRAMQAEEDGYMDRLKELATHESLSNAEKEEAAFLIETLSSRYKDFSATIDETTGKIEGLTLAEKNLNEAQKKQLENQLQRVIENKTAQSSAAVRGHLTPQGWKRYVGYVTGETQDAQEASGYYDSMSIRGKREMAGEMLSEATTKEDIQFWTEELNRLSEIQDAQEKLNALRETGKETAKEHAAELRKSSEESRKAIEEEAKAYETYHAERRRNEEDEARRAEAAAQRDLEKLKRERQAEERERQAMRSEGLRAMGKGRQASYEEAILSATHKKGEELTGDEYNRVIEIVNAKSELNTLQRSVHQSLDYAPRVNSLIARGGSEAPVKMPRVEDLQARSLSELERIERAANVLIRYASDWSTI